MLYSSFPDVYANTLLLFRYTLAAYEDCNFLNEILLFDIFCTDARGYAIYRCLV